MGIRDLWQKALSPISKEKSVKFDVAAGKRIGVDISVWLHKTCHKDSTALCMTCEPMYPPESLLLSLKQMHQQLVDAKITPVYVFDGARHPMKSVARAARNKKLDC
jgi:hypothetical protein